MTWRYDFICSFAVWKGCTISLNIQTTKCCTSKGGEALIEKQCYISRYTVKIILYEWCKTSAMSKSIKCLLWSIFSIVWGEHYGFQN